MSQPRSSKSAQGAQISQETSKFLKDMLKDKNLSLRAQQEVQSSIKAGSSHWVECVNSGVASYQPAASKTCALIKAPKPSSKQQQPQPPPFRPCIRTQQQIEAAAGPVERYAGGAPGIDRQAEKERLAAVFTYGREGAEAMMHNNARTARVAAAAPRSKPLFVREQLIDQIVDEVNERTRYLQEMKCSSLSCEQQATIKAEVAQRLARLQKLGLQ